MSKRDDPVDPAMKVWFWGTIAILAVIGGALAALAGSVLGAGIVVLVFSVGIAIWVNRQ